MNPCVIVLAAVLVAGAWGMVPAEAGDIEVEAQAEAIRREQIEGERNDRRRDQQQTHDRRTKDAYDWDVDTRMWQRDQVEGRRQDEHERLERQRDEVIGRDDRQRDAWSGQREREVRQERERAEWEADEARAADGYPWPPGDPRQNAYRQMLQETRDLEHQIDQLVETGRVREADQMEQELKILRDRLDEATPRPFFLFPGPAPDDRGRTPDSGTFPEGYHWLYSPF